MPVERVVVEVRLQGEARGQDMEVPPDVPAAQLAGAIAAALDWPRAAGDREIEYAIEATPPGRVLGPDETLAQAQAWDGSLLVFAQREAPAPALPAQGFAWKQLS